jgi:hypothetical protein
VRRRESIALRSVSKKLGIPARQLQSLENEFEDLPISMIYRWAQALKVPVHELLLEDQLDDESAIAPSLRDRARMVRIMKTVEAIRVATEHSGVSRLVDNLREQLLQIMPELGSITSWPQYGRRRSGEDYGRTALQVFPDLSELGDDT